MNRITLIIPAYNEARNLPKLAEALRPLMSNDLTACDYDWEVLMVNDGSRDDTLGAMRELHDADSRFQYVSLSRNFGKENALLAGLDYSTGDAAVIMDADLQHPVDAIPRMIQRWEEGYDDVYGKRLSRGRESFLRRGLTKAFYYLLKKSTHIDVLPNVGDFRLLDRKCVDALREMRETQRYSKGLFSWIGFRKTEVQFETADRTEGKSSFGYLSLFNLAVEGITSFTTAPLRFASVMGLITAACALVYLVYVFVRTLLYGDPVSGYPTIMCVMLFLGGCQLIALGIIGEYISRIFVESKRRPPYLVEYFSGEKPKAGTQREN